MRKKVIIYTQAYNATSTLQRTIDSVKGQTYTDWIHFIVDNASSDGTDRLIMNAALSDTRVIPYSLARNSLLAFTKFWNVLANIFQDCYFMALDADDVIAPDCLEKMVAFLESNHLDIAACGTDFVSVTSDAEEVLIKRRDVDNDLIIEGKEFADKFRIYKPYTNEYWAKLYRFNLVNEQNTTVYTDHHYDSVIVLNMFFQAQRVGILAGSLHKAYIGATSLSQAIKGIADNSVKNHPIEEQVFHWLDGTPYIRNVICTEHEWDYVNETYLSYKNYLLNYGELSADNEAYLFAIYLGWIHERIIKMLIAHKGNEKVVMYRDLKYMMASNEFVAAFSYKKNNDEFVNINRRKEILEQLKISIMVSAYDAVNMEYIKDIVEIITDLQGKIE